MLKNKKFPMRCERTDREESSLARKRYARRFNRDIIIATLAQARAFLLEPLVRRSKKVGESDQRARRDDADT